MSQAQSEKITKVIDARGSFCPGPLMEVIRAIKEGQVGDIVEVWSTDSGSQRDIPKWADKAGHAYLGTTHEQDYDRITVKKTK